MATFDFLIGAINKSCDREVIIDCGNGLPNSFFLGSI
jgi:hypothetical protein